MQRPLNNTRSLEEDAVLATRLMGWQKELETEIKNRSVPNAIFQHDPVRCNLTMCRVQIVHATEVTVLQIFRYNTMDQLCLIP